LRFRALVSVALDTFYHWLNFFIGVINDLKLLDGDCYIFRDSDGGPDRFFDVENLVGHAVDGALDEVNVMFWDLFRLC
jgi:hypothetical protein